MALVTTIEMKFVLVWIKRTNLYIEYLNFLNTVPKSKEKRFAIMITKLCYHLMKYQ